MEREAHGSAETVAEDMMIDSLQEKSCKFIGRTIGLTGSRRVARGSRRCVSVSSHRWGYSVVRNFTSLSTDVFRRQGWRDI